MSACVAGVAAWVRANRKTEIIWLTSARRQHQIPVAPITVGTDEVAPVHSVRDLGIFLSSDLSMRTHISRTVSNCFAVLRQIRSIRRSVTRPVLKALVAALVLTKLDYGSVTLAGIPATQLNRLQSVLHAAARLVFHRRKFDHVTPSLRELHWLRVPERITFRLATLAYKCQHGSAPHYLAAQLQRVADMESRRRLRSAASAALFVPRTAHPTIGDRAFSVAAAHAWNSLPLSVQSAESLDIFRRRLKTELFARSFPVD